MSNHLSRPTGRQPQGQDAVRKCDQADRLTRLLPTQPEQPPVCQPQQDRGCHPPRRAPGRRTDGREGWPPGPPPHPTCLPDLASAPGTAPRSLPRSVEGCESHVGWRFPRARKATHFNKLNENRGMCFLCCFRCSYSCRTGTVSFRSFTRELKAVTLALKTHRAT